MNFWVYVQFRCRQVRFVLTLISSWTGTTKTTKQFDAHYRNDYGKYVHLHKTTHFQNKKIKKNIKFKYTSENTESVIKNGQSRETSNIGHKTQIEDKQKTKEDEQLERHK